MCGFVVLVSLTGEPPQQTMLDRMTRLLIHRGPDDSGTFLEGSVGLGFRRLSILDLAPSGHQPMLSEDARHVIVFNGEIYNYVELRAELEKHGHRFVSTGDTEVLLAAYRQWGRECLGRLNGMWAFVIYDRIARTIFGSRDRFGVKPLFHYRSDSGSRRAIVLTSEIKAIRDSGFADLAFDWQTIAAHALEGRLDADQRTFYAGVRSIPAGTAFEIDSRGEMKGWRYWSLLEAAEARPMPGDVAAEYASLFENAVHLRMRADVPVGVLLSGGMDSTSIICSMARHLPPPRAGSPPLNAFCYLDEEFDEAKYLQATLTQTQAHLKCVEAGAAELWRDLEVHLWHQDEPVHSFTSVVGYQLMKLARADGVKVLLNGNGADEVIAGYSNYFIDYWVELMRAGRAWSALREMQAHKRLHGKSAGPGATRVLRVLTSHVLHRVPGYGQLAARRRAARVNEDSWVSQELKQHWRPRELAPVSSLSDALRWSLERESLPLYLRVEDRNSMAQSVEVRLPFMDYRLIALAFRLGSEWKLRGGYNKFVLRESMRGRIPEVVRARPRKFGFPTSVNAWFRDALYVPLRDYLASRAVRESGLWNVAEVTNALERHRRGEIQAGARLFDVAQVCLWAQGSRAWPADARAREASAALAAGSQERAIPHRHRPWVL